MEPRTIRFGLLRKLLLYIALFLGAELVSMLVFGAFFLASGHSESQNFFDAVIEYSETHSTAVMLPVYGIVVAVLYIFNRLRGVSFLEKTALNKKIDVKTALLCVVMGFSANFWMSLILNLIPLPQAWVQQYSESAAALATSNPIIDLLTIVLIAPLVEEIFFRGAMMNTMLKSTIVPIAIIGQGLIFGAIHGSPLWMIYAAVFGCILGYVRILTGSLWSVILFHILFNAAPYAFTLFVGVAGDSIPLIYGTLLASAALFLGSLYVVYRRSDSAV